MPCPIRGNIQPYMPLGGKDKSSGSTKGYFKKQEGLLSPLSCRDLYIPEVCYRRPRTLPEQFLSCFEGSREVTMLLSVKMNLPLFATNEDQFSLVSHQKLPQSVSYFHFLNKGNCSTAEFY